MLDEQLLIGSVFLAGFASFFAPCTFPLMPVYLGILLDESNEYKKLHIGKIQINVGAIIKTLCFVFGLSTSFIILGFASSSVSKFLNHPWIIRLAGLFVVVLGLHQMGILHFNKLDSIQGIRINNQKGKALGAYLTGLSFSLGWTPCIGPILGAILVVSATSGQQFYGVLLMLIYSLGLTIPFLVMTIFAEHLKEHFQKIKKYLPKIKWFGGLLIVIMGIVLMLQQLPSLLSILNRLF